MADIAGHRIKSIPYWLIQEAHLTYEPSVHHGPFSPMVKVQETGEGLTEYADQILKNEGSDAFIEFLNHLNIKFYDGGRKGGGGGGIGSPHDPTKPDLPPNWSNFTSDEKEGLDKAICDFIDRHQKRILLQHARKGNINGLKNFMDVFLETNQLVFLWCQRGLIKPSKAVSKLLKNISILAVEDDLFDFPAVYLAKMLEMQRGNLKLLAETLILYEVPGHLRAALLLIQIIRWKDDEKPKKSPIEYLKNIFEKMVSILRPLGLDDINSKDVGRALNEYLMVPNTEKKEWLAYL